MTSLTCERGFAHNTSAQTEFGDCSALFFRIVSLVQPREKMQGRLPKRKCIISTGPRNRRRSMHAGPRGEARALVTSQRQGPGKAKVRNFLGKERWANSYDLVV